MTATDELHRLLDERGAEYTVIPENAYTREYIKIGNIEILTNDRDEVAVYYLTPEQAVEATLGMGTCHDKNGFDPELGFECTVCGTMVDSYMVTPLDTGHEVQLRFCPFCGAKVVGA